MPLRMRLYVGCEGPDTGVPFLFICACSNDFYDLKAAHMPVAWDAAAGGIFFDSQEVTGGVRATSELGKRRKKKKVIRMRDDEQRKSKRRHTERKGQTEDHQLANRKLDLSCEM